MDTHAKTIYLFPYPPLTLDNIRHRHHQHRRRWIVFYFLTPKKTSFRHVGMVLRGCVCRCWCLYMHAQRQTFVSLSLFLLFFVRRRGKIKKDRNTLLTILSFALTRSLVELLRNNKTTSKRSRKPTILSIEKLTMCLPVVGSMVMQAKINVRRNLLYLCYSHEYKKSGVDMVP